MASPQDLVRAARGSAGLTQRGLAARAGTSAAAINRYERGKAVPDLETLERVLGACGFVLRLTMQPLRSQPLGDIAAEDQPERDRAAVREAVSRADADGWVRAATVDRSG
jgi:transcriptional regulator with XRE-family HTH domain